MGARAPLAIFLRPRILCNTRIPLASDSRFTFCIPVFFLIVVGYAAGGLVCRCPAEQLTKAQNYARKMLTKQPIKAQYYGSEKPGEASTRAKGGNALYFSVAEAY